MGEKAEGAGEKVEGAGEKAVGGRLEGGDEMEMEGEEDVIMLLEGVASGRVEMGEVTGVTSEESKVDKVEVTGLPRNMVTGLLSNSEVGLRKEKNEEKNNNYRTVRRQDWRAKALLIHS